MSLTVGVKTAAPEVVDNVLEIVDEATELEDKSADDVDDVDVAPLLLELEIDVEDGIEIDELGLDEADVLEAEEEVSESKANTEEATGKDGIDRVLAIETGVETETESGKVGTGSPGGIGIRHVILGKV